MCDAPVQLSSRLCHACVGVYPDQSLSPPPLCRTGRLYVSSYQTRSHAANKNDLSLVVRKPAFCICGNKDADQLRGNRGADQRLCFRYIDSTIPLLPKYEISSL